MLHNFQGKLFVPYKGQFRFSCTFKYGKESTVNFTRHGPKHDHWFKSSGKITCRDMDYEEADTLIFIATNIMKRHFSDMHKTLPGHARTVTGLSGTRLALFATDIV